MSRNKNKPLPVYESSFSYQSEDLITPYNILDDVGITPTTEVSVIVDVDSHQPSLHTHDSRTQTRIINNPTTPSPTTSIPVSVFTPPYAIFENTNIIDPYTELLSTRAEETNIIKRQRDTQYSGRGSTVKHDDIIALESDIPSCDTMNPIYSDFPESYNSSTIIPDITTLPYDHTNVTSVKYDFEEKNPFQSTPLLDLSYTFLKSNTLLMFTSYFLCFIFFLYIFLQVVPDWGKPTPISKFPDTFVFLTLFCILICVYYACLIYDVFIIPRYRQSDKIALQKYKCTQAKTISSIVSDNADTDIGIDTQTTYVSKTNVGMYMYYLQKNAIPRLFIHIVAFDKVGSSWKSCYHAQRPVNTITWKDISMNRKVFLNRAQESSRSLYKIAYEYDYILTPGQEILLQSLVKQCQQEESWRGDHVVAYVSYATHLEESTPLFNSPFNDYVGDDSSRSATKQPEDEGNNITQGLISASDEADVTSRQQPVEVSSENQYSYQSDVSDEYTDSSTSAQTHVHTHNSHDSSNSELVQLAAAISNFENAQMAGDVVDEDSFFEMVYSTNLKKERKQIETHHILSNKQYTPDDILRSIIFHPITKLFILFTALFSWMYFMLYTYVVETYTYKSRKFLVISPQIDSANDFVRLNTMRSDRIRQ